MVEPVDRFRSFAERYLVARAASFRPGHELEDAWNCVQDAQKAYGMIAQKAHDVNAIEREEQRKAQAGMVAGVAQATPTTNAAAPTVKATQLFGVAAPPPIEEVRGAMEMLKEYQAVGITPPPSLVKRLYQLAKGGK